MRRISYYFLFIALLGVQIPPVCAQLPSPEKAASAVITPAGPDVLPSIQAKQANWAFSGLVTNENNEEYAYFFYLQRNAQSFHGTALLMENSTKKVVIYEESKSILEQSESTQWEVGNLFLRFNPINNSWIIKKKNNRQYGFNFKVDMLGQADNRPKPQYLRQGVAFLAQQTGRLNGHFQLEDGKEQFVTGKKAWFRQIWVRDQQALDHIITTILCSLNDSSAFYFASLPEADTLRAAVAGWRDEQGFAAAMSQFVTVEDGDSDLVSLKIAAPKVTLNFVNRLASLNNNSLMAGFLSGTLGGFCAISEDVFLAGTLPETAPPNNQAEGTNKDGESDH